LWARVAAGVRALRPTPDSALQPETQPGALPKRPTAPSLTKGPPRVTKPIDRATPSARRARQRANTLDGTWDRAIATGTIAPERTVDLHGCTLAQAHTQLDQSLARAVADGVRVILLITGRAPRSDASRIDLPLRGIIRASVPDWIAASPHADAIVAVRRAHPRHGGAGALYVVLRRVGR